MRPSLPLAGVLVVSALGFVSISDAPYALETVAPRGGALMAGALAFFSCLTGMMIAHIHQGSRRAHETAARLTKSNVDLERLVHARTRALSEKVSELEEARVAAVEANAAKSRFLATMSHELRTPLNAILGFSELIKREMFGPAGDGRYVDYAGHIHESGAHLLSLIRDILDLSKIEAGRMELSNQMVIVGEVVEEALRLAGERSYGGHRVTVFVEDNLPLLYADRRATTQMLLNLLSNAMKFTPASGAIAVTAVLREDGGVTLNVRDSGVGIAHEDIPKALAPYGQVTNVEVRQPCEGTGLGLPIVNALMKLHGGSLELESARGQGTRVSLHFPAERSAREQLTAA